MEIFIYVVGIVLTLIGVVVYYTWNNKELNDFEDMLGIAFMIMAWPLTLSVVVIAGSIAVTVSFIVELTRQLTLKIKNRLEKKNVAGSNENKTT